ncbi:unnamed protein product, partial [Effrenium voratum]
ADFAQTGAMEDAAKRHISQAFQSLIDQVVLQHSVELQECQRSLELQQSNVSQMEDQVVRLRTENAVLRVPKGGMERMVTEDSVVLRVPKGNMERMVTEESRMSTCSTRLKHQQNFSAAIMKQHQEVGEVKARQVLDVWETIEEEEEEGTGSCLRAFLTSTRYEMILAAALCLNVLWMAWELQVSGSQTGLLLAGASVELSSWDQVYVLGDYIFTGLFILDAGIRMAVLRQDFWTSRLNYVDIAVNLACVAEIIASYAMDSTNSSFLRLVKIAKLARALRMFSMDSVLASLQLLLKCLLASSNMLFWSFLLLSFVQGVAAIVVSILCRDYLVDANAEIGLRQAVHLYYGTFTRSFLTMFEVLFANWGPPCRVLVDNVSEWFSVFFLLYRCVLGFAVLNVVNAVFVQQTMKTASSDDEIAFKQKQKDVDTYTRKVKKLFQSMNLSGDGAINFQEFAKLVESPKIQFWMSQLELEYHDLLSLFEFLDNGDGEITLMEFIEGASRLRGNAKALDVWRMETKLEVLFEEVLSAVRPTGTSIQDVFDNSPFRHMKAARPSESVALAPIKDFAV